ncbi:MAG: primosomal protein N' [Deltaproteobacteria bacterium]|nr:primosomal protein N' [Deltaproteobacteria bacterium]
MAGELNSFASVALPVPLRMVFTYRVPAEIDRWVAPGAAVEVRLRNARETGIVLERTARPAGIADSAMRDVLDVRSSTPIFPPDMFAFLKWAAEYYLEPIGEMLRAAAPPGLFADRNFSVHTTGRDAGGVENPDALKVLAYLSNRGAARLSQVVSKSGARFPRLGCSLLGESGHARVCAGAHSAAAKKVVRLAGEPSEEVVADLFRKSRRTAELLDLLVFRGEVPLSELEARFKGAGEKVRKLREMGLAVDAVPDEQPAAGGPTVPLKPPPFDLSADQTTALEKIASALGRGFASMLLYGVTGSGKTEVYLRAADLTLRSGKSVLMLVPEISLSPQLAARTRARFPAEVAVLHSGLREADRLASWLDAASGRRRVVLGARSAVFAPLRDIGLLVVDEEHEGAYKQEESPRYHGRDLAIKRAQMSGAVVLLGSATPSLESYHNTVVGKSVLLSLPERVTGRGLPEVVTVDLGEAKKRQAGGSGQSPVASGQLPSAGDRPPASGLAPHASRLAPLPFFLTPQLLIMLGQAIEAGRQVILLLNRRGYSSFVVCRDCGHQFMCDQCSVSMTYHKVRRAFICHYCGRMVPLPERCPACEHERLEMFGLGTERVEAEIALRYPQARVLRLDRDVARDFTDVERVIETFASGGADVLVGTQMVAKGHHFPNVTFVAIIIADIGLSVPDFRAGERLFGLLSQVAGRSGRGTDEGRVLIQTFNPGHYTVEAAKLHDYRAFFETEIAARRSLLYPPFSRLIRVVFESAGKEKAIEAGDRFAGDAARAAGRGVQVLGPAPCVIDRIKGAWRYQVVIKGKTLGPVKKAIGAMLRPGGAWHRMVGVRLVVDVDPIGML